MVEIGLYILLVINIYSAVLLFGLFGEGFFCIDQQVMKFPLNIRSFPGAAYEPNFAADVVHSPSFGCLMLILQIFPFFFFN